MCEEDSAVSKMEVKGMVLDAIVGDIERLRDEGRLEEDELQARLEPEDLALLEAKLNLGAWYPLGSYQRMTTLLWEFEGDRDPEYMRQRGSASARRMIDGGVYQQLNSLKREREANAEWVGEYRRRVVLFTSIHRALLSVGTWTVEDDPDHADRIRIVVSDADGFPEVLRFAMEGFLTETARERGMSTCWTSDRLAPDRILFKMDRGYRD